MKIEFICEEEKGLKDYLIDHYSFSFFGYLKDTHADILSNDKVISFNDIIYQGDHIRINYIGIKQEGTMSNLPFEIVYEDEDIIVVNKESGVASIPSKLHQEDTLFNRLKYYYKDTDVTLHFINRLDKDTSGLVLIAKSQHSACLFNKVRETFLKEYKLKTYYPLKDEEGVIELPIKRVNGMKRWVKEDGKYAKTGYKLVNKENNTYTYIVKLYTGLTHQIRVHFAYLNAPIINDSLYNEVDKINGVLNLHSYHLKFYHPFKNEWIDLESEPRF